MAKSALSSISAPATNQTSAFVSSSSCRALLRCRFCTRPGPLDQLITMARVTQLTNVSVYLGNNPTAVYSQPLAPSSTFRKVLDNNPAGGPVRIFGDNVNAKILAGMRVIYGGNMSFDELMAYPTAGLSPEYWFPFYNHNMANLDTEIRIGVP